MDALAIWIDGKIPAGLHRKWDDYLDVTFSKRGVDVERNILERIDFQRKQIKILLYGLLFTLGFAIMLLSYSVLQEQYHYRRNPFGTGEKNLYLHLEHEGEVEDYSLSLQEQALSPQEEEAIFQKFFKEVTAQLKGANPSLDRVNQSLDFVDCLPGYPFTISYEPEDISYIDWNGDLGEAALSLKGNETIETGILLEASYKEYLKKERIPIILIAPSEKEESIFARFEEYISGKEAEGRKEELFSLDSEWNDLKVEDANQRSRWKLPFFIILITVLLLLRNHSLLREEEKRRHKENMEDFPLIVHLFTLYMGAGLSFSSTVSRISCDYEKKKGSRAVRYAFEQLTAMNHSLQMGLRPKNVCLEWGNCFREKMYAKFAMLLAQGLSKGSREIRSMMETEQEDAFQIQIDYVRKEGEEVSTKLLFPMILLLFIIMILVMFPAMMQFRIG